MHKGENFIYLESEAPSFPAVNPSSNRAQVRSESIVGKKFEL